MRVETLGQTDRFAVSIPLGEGLSRSGQSTSVADVLAVALLTVTGLALSVLFALSQSDADGASSFLAALSS